MDFKHRTLDSDLDFLSEPQNVQSSGRLAGRARPGPRQHQRSFPKNDEWLLTSDSSLDDVNGVDEEYDDRPYKYKRGIMPTSSISAQASPAPSQVSANQRNYFN